jgi:hypothetical protein
MPDPKPIEQALSIYERRVGRKIGAVATLAGVAGAGLLGALRYVHLLPIDYVFVAGSLAAGMLVGPLADRIARRVARWRMKKELTAEADHGGTDAPLELRERLRAQTLASAEERASTALPLAKNAVLAIVGFLWPVALVAGLDIEMIGKALSYLALHGSIPIAAFAVAAYARSRRMLEEDDERRWPELTAMAAALIAPALTTDLGFAAIPIALFAFGLAGLFVLLPATTWAHRRTFREQKNLTQLLLPPRDSDADDVQRILRSTIEWDGCPGRLRAS